MGENQVEQLHLPSQWRASACEHRQLCCPAKRGGTDRDACLMEMLGGLLPARKVAVAQMRFYLIIVTWNFCFILLLIKVFTFIFGI